MRRKGFWLLGSVILLAMLLAGCSNGRQPAGPSGEPSAPSQAAHSADTMPTMRIQIITDTQSILFQLNHSPAALSLYEQLPLTLAVENYADNEKIFYPPEKLDVSDTPPAEGPAGTLAYYEPWGDVAIFYGECPGASGLYELGEAISGAEQIKDLAGEIRIEKWEETPSGQDVPEAASLPTQAETEESGGTVPVRMQVQVGGRTFYATLEENAAASAFARLMEAAPVALHMEDYSGFEKVEPLGTDLPASNTPITTQAGDIVLYQGNQIVLFYGSNTWSYTRIGKIDDLSGWEESLGSGDVTVTFSLVSFPAPASSDQKAAGAASQHS